MSTVVGWALVRWDWRSYILAPEKLLLNWTESCLDQMSKENAFDVAEQEGAQKASLYMQGCCIKLTSFVVSVSSFIAFLVGTPPLPARLHIFQHFPCARRSRARDSSKSGSLVRQASSWACSI